MSNPRALIFANDSNGNSSYAAPFPSVAYGITVPAGSERNFVVPSNVTNWIVAFGYAGSPDLWIAVNATAANPSGAGNWAVTTSVLNPSALEVYAGNTISVYNNGSTPIDLGAAFYARP